mmetsp:Transcript_25562/g.57913  ORF Transcript_25562/g.57913 Transcript_25562/m.57913 type:complete len:353 (+) Transcript_25562:103-1161(+)
MAPPSPHDPLRSWMQDIAAFVALLLMVMSAFGFVQSFGMTREAAQVRHWAALPWRPESCSVQTTGVAYRGTCKLDSDQERHEDKDFAECLGGPDLQPGQTLQDIIDKTRFNSTQGLCGQVATEKFEEAAQASLFGGRRLFMHFFHPHGPGEMVGSRWVPINFRCHDSYLPWALVQLPEGLRCAYAFGAPKASIYSHWEEVQSDLKDLDLAIGLHKGAECWRPHGDACTVAYQSNRYLLERESGKQEVWRNLAVALACAAAFAGLTSMVWRRRAGRPDHSLVPTDDVEEPKESPLSARVRQLVAEAAAKVAEATPQLSLRSSRRTVRAPSTTLDTRHQNLAADFLYALARDAT